MNFTGRTALVVGASRGFGRGVVESLLAKGTIVCSGVLTLTAVLAIWQNFPPRPLPASASPQDFSAARALRHDAAIASVPHPMGSAQNERVAGYLRQTLHQLGLDVEEETALGITPRFAAMGRVHNILASLRGTEGRHAVLFVAHYDSQPVAPGASDDAHAVASILEMLRALRSQARLRNDIDVLFTDGEEDGLLGASAYLDAHRERRIDAVFNFEGRGNAGAAVMFQTSPANDRLIGEFIAAVPDAVATSISQEVYKRMPNDTDFSIFLARGWRGLNFAHLGGWPAYHTPRDTVATLDLATLQHHGNYMLGLARRFGNLDLDRNPLTSRQAAIYFSLPLLGLVHYPDGIAIPLSIVCLVVLLALLIVRVRREDIGAGGLLRGAALLSVAGILTAVLALAVQLALAFIQPLVGDGDVVNSGAYALALVFVCLGAYFAGYELLRARVATAEELAYAGLSLWTLMGVAVALVVPGASYYVALPSLAGLVWAALPRSTVTGDVARLGFATVSVYFLAPLAYWLLIIFGVSRFGSQVVGAFLGFSLVLLFPALEVVRRPSRWLAPALAFVVAVTAVLFGLATVRYDGAHPKASNIYYALDADTGRALWASSDADAWTLDYLGSAFEHQPLPNFFPAFFTDRAGPLFLTSEAPHQRLSAPAFEGLGAKIEGANRVLNFIAKPTRAGRWLMIYLPTSDVLAATVDGEPFQSDPAARRRPLRGWAVTYINPPASGVPVTVRVAGTKVTTIRLIEMSMGLPEALARERPASTVPIQTGDASLVGRTILF